MRRMRRITSTSLGFIAFDPQLKDEFNNLHPEPIGFAFGQVAGNRHEHIHVVDFFTLPLDRFRLINGVLDIAEQWPLPEIYCDQIEGIEAYTFLNGDRAYSNEVARRRELSNTLYPRLNSYALRHKDPHVRQRDALAHRLTPKDGKEYPDIIFHDDLGVDAETVLKEVGKNAGLDAVAGFVELAAKLQARLRKQLTADELSNTPMMIAFT